MISGIDLNVEFSKIKPLDVELLASDSFDLKMVDQMNLNQSYKTLDDKPKLDGRVIIGDIPELDPTVPDWAKAATPPEYTAEDVGAIPDGAITVLDSGDFEEMWESLGNEGG